MSRETEQIKERINIADVVGEYVKLKQAGQSMKGLCPFHSEKTPSFIVTPARGSWHCFGCNEGGDVFSFIQKIEGIEFPAALKLLADRAGVELSHYESESKNYRQRLFDVLTSAASFYHEILLNQKAGAKAKEYLMQRGLTEHTIQQFTIGYAPHSWDVLRMWLAKKGYTDEEMIAAGLLGRSKDRPFDRFRGRIMFPVLDLQGRVVAFGGRIVPWHETGNEGKYVNSPETALYEKRRTVYNLSRAKKVLRAGTPCIVVEGYMDVVMLVQSGVENVVATSGTAFTQDHIALLQRFTNTLHFAFDGDGAGWKATIAATQSALAQGMNVETITMPAGIDPADLAKDSPDALAVTLSATRPLIEVLVERLGAGSEKEKDQALTALIPLLRLVKNPIQLSGMVEQVSRLLKTPETQIMRLISEEQPIPSSPTPSRDSSAVSYESREKGREQQLLGILIANPVLQEHIFSLITPEHFLDLNCREVYKELQRAHASGQSLREELLSLLAAIESQAQAFSATSTFSAQEEALAIVRLLQRRHLLSRLKTLQQESSPDALVEFQVALQELAQIDV